MENGIKIGTRGCRKCHTKEHRKKALQKAHIDPSLPDNSHEMRTSMDKKNYFLIIL
jgi:hypothetical protein